MHLKKNIMRKTYLALLVLTAGLLSGNLVVHASDPAHAEQSSVAPAEGISRLKAGNGRYTNGNPQHPRQSSEEREKLTKSQHPFAIVLGCSDSRVPAEIVLDQGLGDLFVVRVAGYAVDHLAVRLIVVLGHQRCGAVQAAKDTIAAKGKAPGHIQSLVTAIEPAVEATVKDDLEATVKANVRNVVQALRSSTPVLKAKIDAGELKV